jgi:hypothetical protein
VYSYVGCIGHGYSVMIEAQSVQSSHADSCNVDSKDISGHVREKNAP